MIYFNDVDDDGGGDDDVSFLIIFFTEISQILRLLGKH